MNKKNSKEKQKLDATALVELTDNVSSRADKDDDIVVKRIISTKIFNQFELAKNKQ